MTSPGRTEPLLEVCVESVRAAAIAERGGAHRIELCADLSVGGVTPDEGLMRAARQACELPILAMIRPRPGDFRYAEDELARMEREIDLARACGLDGVVFGALYADGTIDDYAMQLLIERAEGLLVTFHRAFDLTPVPRAALDRLVALGVPRILTSGSAPTALAGAAELAALVTHAGDRIVVMPGGNVRAENIAELLRRTGALEFHSSVGGDAGIDEDRVRETARELAAPGHP
jgi:copper homeostasis protein